MGSELDPELWQLYLKVYFYLPKPLKLQSGFAIISLWNPAGKQMNRLDNKKHAHKVKCFLQRKNIAAFELWGGDKPMLYREHSVAIALPLAQAYRVSRFAQQLAFYYIEGDRVTLYCSHKKRTFERLTRPFNALKQVQKPPLKVNYAFA